MTMTDREICYDYQTAKNKSIQVGILAELNGTTKQNIESILVQYGILEKKKTSKPKSNYSDPKYNRLSRFRKKSVDELYALYKMHRDCIESILEVLELKAKNDMQR